MASSSPLENTSAPFCLQCVATGQSEWACNAAASSRDSDDDPEPIPVELNEASAALSVCAAPNAITGRIEVTPLTLPPNSSLITDSTSPFYCETGYKVTVTYVNTVHLLSVADVESGELGRIARITQISEIEGIPCRFPLETMIDVNDHLTLLSVSRPPGNTPLVNLFAYKEGSEFHLRPVVVQTYVNGQLTYLSKPATLGGNPIFNLMIIRFSSLESYNHRVMFLREERVRNRWRIERMQLTKLSPPVTITVREVIPDDGSFCEGPIDPWSHVDGVTSSPLRTIYWMPRDVYMCASLPIGRLFRVQVSTCPLWAYSTSRTRVRFLVHQMVRSELPNIA